MIETNRLSHSDIKKLHHLTKVTLYLLMIIFAFNKKLKEKQLLP